MAHGKITSARQRRAQILGVAVDRTNEAIGLVNDCLDKTQAQGQVLASHKTAIDDTNTQLARIAKDADERLLKHGLRIADVEDVITRGTFVDRVRWLFTGRVPSQETA